MVTEATPIVSYPNGTDDCFISVLCDCLIYMAFCLCLFSFGPFCCLIGDWKWSGPARSVLLEHFPRGGLRRGLNRVLSNPANAWFIQRTSPSCCLRHWKQCNACMLVVFFFFFLKQYYSRSSSVLSMTENTQILLSLMWKKWWNTQIQAFCHVLIGLA